MQYLRKQRRLVLAGIAVACFAALVVDAFCQPGYHNGWNRTAVGELCSEIRFQARGTTCVFTDDYFAVPLESGGWRVLSRERFGDVDFPLSTEIIVSRLRIDRASGIWSLSYRTHSDHVRVDSATGVAAAPSGARLGALLDAINMQYPGSFPAVTRAADLVGGSSRTSVLWPGLANDAFVVVIAIVMVTALIGLRLQRPRRWMGHCRSCGYDLRDLPQPRCPECGHELDIPNQSA